MNPQEALDSLEVAEDAALEADVPGAREGVAHLRQLIRSMPGEQAKRQSVMGEVWTRDIELQTYASRRKLEEQGDYTLSFDEWESA